MYSVPQSEQLTIFAAALGLGFLLGILYDVLRAFRLSITKSRIALIGFDIIYFLLFGIITFLFILALNKGEIRFYIIAGELIGAFFYYVSFGIAVIKITNKVVSLLHKLYALIFKIISAPFRLIKKFFCRIAEKWKSFHAKREKKSQKIRKKLLPKLHLYVYNLFGMLFPKKCGLKKGGNSFGRNKKREKAD